MKWTLRIFAFLDFCSLLFIYPQVKTQFNSLLGNEPLTSIQFFSRVLFLLTALSLVFSATFLSFPKKAGIIIYYGQLLPRVIFYIFTLGFISLLSYAVNWPYLQNVLMPLIIFTEMLRVYFSYRIQKALF